MKGASLLTGAMMTRLGKTRQPEFIDFYRTAYPEHPVGLAVATAIYDLAQDTPFVRHARLRQPGRQRRFSLCDALLLGESRTRRRRGPLAPQRSGRMQVENGRRGSGMPRSGSKPRLISWT